MAELTAAVTDRVRRVKENNNPWRAVEERDLTPGKKILAVEVVSEGGIPMSRTCDPRHTGGATVIQLDEEPVVGGFVYFHNINPAWDQQCFVSVDEFLADEDTRGTAAGPDIRYWLPIDEERIKL